jgi:hypothetical protein
MFEKRTDLAVADSPKQMSARELAEAMLDYGELIEKAKTLAKTIRDAVLKLEKTQTVGNVRASYSKGRGSYNYEEAANENELDLTEYQKVVTTTVTRYIDACKDAKLDMNTYYTPPSGGPKVTLKIID